MTIFVATPDHLKLNTPLFIYLFINSLRPRLNRRPFADDIFICIFMPPPLGAGGIMFSGCPSVRPSVRPTEAWNNLFSPVHGSVGPSDQPWPFCSMSVRLSVRPSGEVSGHLPENAWREWSEILHVDVSWAPPELIRLWSWSVDFPPFGVTLT